jgi:nitrite reductase (NADH) small subunit
MSATAEGTWTRVGAPGDVPVLEGRAVTVAGRRIAVFRLDDGGWAAVDAACPHKGGPLQDGIVGDGCVTCPLHQQRFRFTDLVAHEVRVDGDGIFVRLAGAA